jgi:hypothetical protein
MEYTECFLLVAATCVIFDATRSIYRSLRIICTTRAHRQHCLEWYEIQEIRAGRRRDGIRGMRNG